MISLHQYLLWISEDEVRLATIFRWVISVSIASYDGSLNSLSFIIENYCPKIDIVLSYVTTRFNAPIAIDQSNSSSAWKIYRESGECSVTSLSTTYCEKVIITPDHIWLTLRIKSLVLQDQTLHVSWKLQGWKYNLMWKEIMIRYCRFICVIFLPLYVLINEI